MNKCMDCDCDIDKGFFYQICSFLELFDLWAWYELVGEK